MQTTFLLNGESITADTSPTMTLLDWLRDERGLRGTKEGCNEGDCGACTVMVTDDTGAKTLNACILFVPQLEGKVVRTVEGIAAPDGALHPAQQALIDHHGSQCGFCTPGFVVSMATAHLNKQKDHDDQLAGNLCRCTGYAPIIKAARAIEQTPPPGHLTADLVLAQQMSKDAAAKDQSAFRPKSTTELAKWYDDHPDATLIAGATDVGLWVTKEFRDLGPVAFLNGIEDMKGVTMSRETIRIGAMTTLADLQAALAPLYPAFGELIRRYGSVQVRNAATIGGNIANGSPIGDGSPALIALGAHLNLRKGTTRSLVPVEEFFIEYGRQDREPGQFIEAITIPRAGNHLYCYKLSKRFDQDISSVCGCLWIKVASGQVIEARLAYGGMAGTPKRAYQAEAAIVGKAWGEDTVRAGMEALDDDFTPLTDMRASSDYRMKTAKNMLIRAFAESHGQTVTVLDIDA